MQFLPVPPLGYKKNPFLSNPILYPEYLYPSISAFLVNLNAPNKQFSSIGITAYVKIFIYFINNVNIDYFPIIICNHIASDNHIASFEFYSCFSTKIAYL